VHALGPPGPAVDVGDLVDLLVLGVAVLVEDVDLQRPEASAERDVAAQVVTLPATRTTGVCRAS